MSEGHGTLRCALLLGSLAAVFWAAACAPFPPPAADPRAAGGTVSFSHHPHVPGRTDTPEVTFTLEDGAGVRTVRGSTFTTERWATPHSADLPFAAGDSLRVVAVLQGAAGDTLAVGGIVLPAPAGWRWGIRAGTARRSTILSEAGVDPRTFRDHWPLRGEEGSPDPVSFYLRYGGGPAVPAAGAAAP